MHLRRTPVLSAAVLAALCQYAPDLAQAQNVGGVRVRVNVLKKALEQKSGNGPALMGPQSALELEWRLLNTTGEALEIPSPGTVLRLRVAGQGREIPVRTEWAADMTLRARINGDLVSTTLPSEAAALPDGSSLWVRGSTKLLDGSAFAPGEYVLEVDVRNLQQVSAGRARTVPTVDPGFPIQLRILDLNSPERQRRFHLIEGGFYERIDRNRALEHYVALASLRGAPWSDSLPLARMYGELGRQATVVFRRILPDLIGSLEGPLGDILRNARHLRRAAMSFAVEGDVATAATLLRLEKRTPEVGISEEIEQLRKIRADAAGKCEAIAHDQRWPLQPNGRTTEPPNPRIPEQPNPEQPNPEQPNNRADRQFPAPEVDRNWRAVKNCQCRQPLGLLAHPHLNQPQHRT